MRSFHTAVLALILALPSMTLAQQALPTDELGLVAWNTMEARASEQLLPARNLSSTERTVHATVSGGTLAVTFGAEAGDSRWSLRSYVWQHDRLADEDSAHAPETTASGSGAPENPDPNPPTHHATPGDKSTNVFQPGQWRYTVKYTYGAREGAPGWHVDSIESVYNPTPPPGPIDHQEK